MTEASKSVQAKVLFPTTLFSEYRFMQDEPSRFSVRLDLLLECLSIFGTQGETALRIAYNGYGTPLTLTCARAHTKNPRGGTSILPALNPDFFVGSKKMASSPTARSRRWATRSRCSLTCTQPKFRATSSCGCAAQWESGLITFFFN